MSEGQAITSHQYLSALHAFDEAVCEALAVGQASSNRMASPNHGWASYIFAQICSHATNMIRAAPKSRWVKAGFEDWSFTGVAGHSRAIIEGYLLFLYLYETPENEMEWQARINVMHLNDCTRRIKLHTNLNTEDSGIAGFKLQAEELRTRLKENSYFTNLSTRVQSKSLTGDWLMLLPRDEMVEKAGFEKLEFNAIYDLLSNHTHILPMSFYRTEPNGRGTGIENDTDRAYIFMMLELCAKVLIKATNWVVIAFPDTANVRQGVLSKFSPGPRENLPNSNRVSNKGKSLKAMK